MIHDTRYMIYDDDDDDDDNDDDDLNQGGGEERQVSSDLGCSSTPLTPATPRSIIASSQSLPS